MRSQPWRWVRDLMSVAAGVGPDQFEPREALADPVENAVRAIAVLNLPSNGQRRGTADLSTVDHSVSAHSKIASETMPHTIIPLTLTPHPFWLRLLG
jgi:hypothetical protein